jgi:hypothetical protein
MHFALRVVESTTSTLPVRSTLVALRTPGSALTLMSNALKESLPRSMLTATVSVPPNPPVTLELAALEGQVVEDEPVTHTTPGMVKNARAGIIPKGTRTVNAKSKRESAGFFNQPTLREKGFDRLV